MDSHASPMLCCFLFLVAFCSFPILCNSLTSCFPHERDALLSFNNNLPSPSLSWKGLNCCQWHGVHCSNRTSYVIKLHLPKGDTHRRAILSPTLFTLKYLEHLDLSFNGLTGVIPAGLSALTHLSHLDLSFNYFQGQIPKDIASLLKLTHLNLRFAGFNGTLSNQLENLTHLQFLDLSTELVDWDGLWTTNYRSQMLKISNLEWTRNMQRLKHLSLVGVNLSMSGELFGKQISHLRDLHYLNVVDCGLWGSIPTTILNLTSLAHLFLSYNMFSSQIPSWLGNMTALHSLWLSSNNLDGPFPLSLSRLPLLQDLALKYNPLLSGDLSRILGGEWPHLTRFSLLGSKVTGILPSSLGNISCLTNLQLGENMAIEGSIPSSMGNLSALESLAIYHTSLNGTIPASLGRLSSLRVLYLPYNRLSGSIPCELGRLPSLRSLCLNSNKLNGSIPTFVEGAVENIFLEINNLQGDVFLDSFQNSTGLYYLSLSHNKLTVHVNPLWIPKIYLEYLGLASCGISGNLPAFLSTQYRLSSLDMSNNNIVGSIPSWFEELKDLQYLNLSYNHLEGNLPPNINLTKYYSLDLHSNAFSGPPPIPHVESNLGALDLSYNRFTGMIPKKIGMLLPQIMFLACSMNDLTGGIPASIGRLQQLEVLDLSGNGLKGRIPWSITNCSALKILNLANTSLTGHIPSDIGRLWQLKSLHLNDNLLEGNLPQSLVNCSELHILDVGNNLMSGNIPLWIAGFSKMMILVLRENRFQGYLPSELSNLSALHVLDLSHNRLIGFIPRELGKLASMVSTQVKISNVSDTMYYYREQIRMTWKERRLDYTNSILLLITGIDLSGNELSGKIPSEIGNLKGLHTLNISRNSLSGEIPWTLGQVEQLESLDLSCNKLYGKIPPEMLKLSYLSILNVSHNMLHGKIPVGAQFTTFNATYFSGNNGLCGFPLKNTCESSKASGIIPAKEDEDEDEDGEIPWHWYVEWMASFAAGFWGVHGVLFVKKKWRRGYYRAVDKSVVRMDKKVGLSNVLWR